MANIKHNNKNIHENSTKINDSLMPIARIKEINENLGRRDERWFKAIALWSKYRLIFRSDVLVGART